MVNQAIATALYVVVGQTSKWGPKWTKKSLEALTRRRQYGVPYVITGHCHRRISVNKLRDYSSRYQWDVSAKE